VLMAGDGLVEGNPKKKKKKEREATCFARSLVRVR
jgi:hypothetical protein